MSDPKRTTNYKLYKPVSGEPDVAKELNENLDKIDDVLQALNNSKADSGHRHSELATKVELSGKADSGHQHSELATIDNVTNLENRINAIESFLTVDLSKVNIIILITEVDIGYRFKCEVIPYAFAIKWEIQLTSVSTSSQGHSALYYTESSNTGDILIDQSDVLDKFVSGTEMRANVRVVDRVSGEASAFFTSDVFRFHFKAVSYDKFDKTIINNSDLAMIFLTATNPALAQQLLKVASDTPENIKELIRTGHISRNTGDPETNEGDDGSDELGKIPDGTDIKP